MIKFYCPTCDKKIGVPNEFANRRVKCPQCEAAVSVPDPELATTEVSSAIGTPPNLPNPLPVVDPTPRSAMADVANSALQQPVEVPVDQHEHPAEPEVEQPDVQPTPEPVSRDANRHVNRVRLRVPGYWFLAICGWVGVVGGGCLVLIAIGLSIFNLIQIVGIDDPVEAAVAQTAAMMLLLIMLGSALLAALLGAITLAVRRTAINTWLLRIQFVGH